MYPEGAEGIGTGVGEGDGVGDGEWIGVGDLTIGWVVDGAIDIFEALRAVCVGVARTCEVSILGLGLGAISVAFLLSIYVLKVNIV